MTEQEFAEILALGYERRGVEFKGPGPRSSTSLFARIVRAVLGMANHQDGGLLVLGVENQAGTLNPVGLEPDDLATWRYDDVAAGIAAYADPFVTFDLEQRGHEGKQFVVLHVHEFEEVPVLCRKQYPDILRPGACYVRTRRKPETSEIPSQTEMRELLDLAVTKGIRKFLGQALSAGLTPRPSDVERYSAQLRGLLA